MSDYDPHRRAAAARKVKGTLYYLLSVSLVFALIVAYVLNEGSKQRAVSYVKGIISENDRYKTLDADAESITWDISRKFLGCNAQYSCFTVERTVNVIQGVEVKPLHCEWDLALPDEGSVARPQVFPTNTEARTFFLVRMPEPQQPQRKLSDEEIEKLRQDNQRMFDEDKKRRQLQNKAPAQ